MNTISVANYEKRLYESRISVEGLSYGQYYSSIIASCPPLFRDRSPSLVSQSPPEADAEEAWAEVGAVLAHAGVVGAAGERDQVE